MVFLRKLVFILILLTIPTYLFAEDEEDSLIREQNKTMNVPLVPLVDDSQQQPEPPKAPIVPMDNPEFRSRRLVDSLMNPNENGVPLVGETPENLPFPVKSPGPHK
jgi:hypothetical protein